jgi:glutaredoxin 3
MKIKVYIKPACPWCVELQDFLKEKGIDYQEIDVFADEKLFQEMIDLSGQSKAPTVVIDEQVFADTDVQEIESVLKEKGII